jgi:hypothetical protein
MSRQISGGDAIIAGKLLHQTIKYAAVQTPAMDQDNVSTGPRLFEI